MAYYTNLRMASLKTLDQCDEAEQRIEAEPKSYSNPKAFMRGAHCELKAGAATKLAQVRKRWNALYEQLPADQR